MEGERPPGYAQLDEERRSPQGSEPPSKLISSKSELRTRYADTAASVTLATLFLEEGRYLGLCFLTIASAVAISLPVLLLPLAPASAGVGANGVYYGVYCGVFAVLWAITNWDRLEFLFQQPTDASGTLSPGAAEWSEFEHSGLLVRFHTVGAWRYPVALAIAWITFSATFSAIGLYWGAAMENSLVLFYGAPVAFTLVDCAWFFIMLPRSRRSLWTFASVATLNVLLCLPILLLFVPTVTGVVLERMVPDTLGGTVLLWTHDICVPTLVELLFTTALSTLLPWVLRRAGLLGVSVLEATELHLICVFEASLVMGVFGHPFQVIGVIFILSIFFTAKRLRDAYEDGDPDELYLSWMGHIPGLAAPFIYLVHTTLIRTYINKDHYFIYRCTSGIDWAEKEWVMLILLLMRLALVQLELLYCLTRSRRDVAMVLRGGIESLSKHFAYVTFCLAFAATLFTSCFIIKHDGLALMFVGLVEPADCLSAPGA